MAPLDPEYLTALIASDWKMPIEHLFVADILPPGNSEDWPLPLLQSLAHLSTMTARDEAFKPIHKNGPSFTRARELLTELCTARVEAVGNYEMAEEVGAGGYE
jgi:hypothetical protein